jgi:oligopeptide/dipeptide ABC transporter ATP-binding protein
VTATARGDQAGRPLLTVRDLVKRFPVRGGLLRRELAAIRAVDGVSLDVAEGETLALVGESGCGKSTTARVILRLLPPTSGSVSFAGEDVFAARPGDLRRLRRSMQIVFQDPYASLDPRMTVGAIVAEPLAIHGVGGGGAEGRRARRERAREQLALVGLSPEHGDRYPHEFSGGQRQRIAIARALALDPRLLILDEPVSALDTSIQAQVLNLLADLRERLGLSYLLIAHDLAVVRHVADRIAVMYLGRLVETAPAEAVYRRPRHPYTAALLSAVPVPDPVRERSRARILLSGEAPNPADPPGGCPFHPRCPRAQGRCREEMPPLAPLEPGHLAACFFPHE